MTMQHDREAAGIGSRRRGAVRALALLGLLLVAAACRRQGQTDWENRKTYQSAVAALAEGNLSEAEAGLRQVLSGNPNHAGALCKLAGILLERAGGPNAATLAEAERLARRAIRADSNSTIAWDTMARILERGGKLEEAWQVRRKLLQLDKTDVRNRIAAATLAERLGKPEEAISLLQAGLEGNSVPAALPALRLELGLLLIKQGRAEKGRALLEAIPAGTSEFRMAIEKLGELAARRGDFAAVRRLYQRLVKVDPGDASAWELLAALEERSRNLSAAEEQYLRALKLQRNRIRSWTGLARCRLARNDLQQARYALQQADRLVAVEPAEAPEVARLLVKLGQDDWARAVLAKAELSAGTPEVKQAIRQSLHDLERNAGSDAGKGSAAGAASPRSVKGRQEEQ